MTPEQIKAEVMRLHSLGFVTIDGYFTGSLKAEEYLKEVAGKMEKMTDPT